jgi:hypothetical protein
MVDDVFGSRLLALADPRDDSDWDDVLARSGRAGQLSLLGKRPGRTRRLVQKRFWLVAAVVGVVLLVVGASLAAVRGVPWWEGAAPPVNPKTLDWQLAPPTDGTRFPPTADRSKARTVAKVDGAALVAAPVGDDGYCLIPSLAGSPDLGVSCLYQPGDWLRAYARPASQGPRWIVYGRITDPQAASLDLSDAASERFVVPLQRGGFFLANIPERLWDKLGGKAGAGQIVTASGDTLQGGCVNWGPSPADERAGESGLPFWQEGDAPCRPVALPPYPPRADLDRATKLVSYTLASDFSVWERGTTVAVWRAPAQGGMICTFVGPVPLPKASPGGLPGAGSCSYAAQPNTAPPERPISMSWSSDRAGGLLTGEVSPTSGIVRLELQAGPRTTPLAFANNHFIGWFPPRGRSPGVLPPGGPYLLVAYSIADREVATVDIQKAMDRAMGKPGS